MSANFFYNSEQSSSPSDYSESEYSDSELEVKNKSIDFKNKIQFEVSEIKTVFELPLKWKDFILNQLIWKLNSYKWDWMKKSLYVYINSIKGDLSPFILNKRQGKVYLKVNVDFIFKDGKRKTENMDVTIHIKRPRNPPKIQFKTTIIKAARSKQQFDIAPSWFELIEKELIEELKADTTGEFGDLSSCAYIDVEDIKIHSYTSKLILNGEKDKLMLDVTISYDHPTKKQKVENYVEISINI